MTLRPRVVVIGGSDPGGRAGIVRDVQTLHDYDVDAACAIAAVTAQTDAAVVEVQSISSSLLQQQLVAAWSTGPIHAVKIGMLGSADNVAMLASILSTQQGPAVVLDPVLAASSGGTLLEPAGKEVLCHQLMRYVTLLTPNVAEAAWLSGQPPAQDDVERLQQARYLQALGARNVLLKGGHTQGVLASDILLLADGEVRKFDTSRVDATLRGTGCMLASAIAAGLAHGVLLPQACQHAKVFVHQRLRAVVEAC